MKKVPYKVMTNGESYTQLWASILKAPANGRSTGYDEMKKVVPLVNKLESFTDQHANGFIRLEDAEHEMILEAVKGPNFGQNTAELLEMIESVIEAETEEVPG